MYQKPKILRNLLILNGSSRGCTAQSRFSSARFRKISYRELSKPPPSTQRNQTLTSSEANRSKREIPRDSNSLRHLSTNVLKVEEKYAAVERAHNESATVLKEAKERTSVIKKSVEGFGFQAHRELDDILILRSKAGIDATIGHQTPSEHRPQLFVDSGSRRRPSFSKLLDALCEEEDAQKKFVSWKSRVLGKGFSSTGVYTVLPNRNGFSPK